MRNVPAPSRPRFLRFHARGPLVLGVLFSVAGCSSPDGDGSGTGGGFATGAAPGVGGAGGAGGAGVGGAGGSVGGAAGSGAGAGSSAGAPSGGSSGVAGSGGTAGAVTSGGAGGGAGVAASGGAPVGGAGAGATGGDASSGAAGVAGVDPGTGGMAGTATGGAGAGGASAGASGASGSAGTAGAAGGSSCGSGKASTVPAFPGADGAAAGITGGRCGDVYHVTLLDTDSSDMRPGTLRYGLSNASGARTIVFDVSGVFRLGRTAVSGWNANGNGWDTASRLNLPANVTVAGQTAPGPVVIMGGSVRPGATNIVVRHVTVAPGYGSRSFDEPMKPPVAGDFPDSYVYDAFDISGQKVMLDHVTTVYATDETISMNELANDITIQYAIIAQGQNYPQADAEASGTKYTGHALGSLLQAGSNARISVHHNLYAHLKGRLPRVGTEADKLTTAGVGAFNDFRNNVFYNWLGTAGTGASGQASQNNFIGNFYLAGAGGDDASGGTSTAITTSAGGTGIFSGSDASLTKVYQSGNVKDVNKDGDANDAAALTNSDFASSAIQGSAYTQAPYKGMTETAQAAFDRVLSYAGARQFSRAALETRLVAETRAVSGKIVAWADDPFNASGSEGTEWRSLVATPTTSRAAGFDTDQDGMPDTWESSHGTNAATADNNGDVDSDGYTNLEEYLNELAAFPAPTAILFVGSENERYADSRNFGLAAPGGRVLADAHWQPSRHDLVRSLAPRVVVDAPGQDARAVELAGVTGPALLDVSGGWLDVQEHVSVGAWLGSKANGSAPRAGAVLRLDGGELRVHGRVVLGGAPAGEGVLALAGGKLEAGSLEMRKDAVLRVDAVRARGARVAGSIHLAGRLELEPGTELSAGESLVLFSAQGDVSGRFASVPSGHAVDIVGGRVVLRSTRAAGPELFCALPPSRAALSGG